MASIFCPDCGAKVTYTLNKPKFCQGCGVRFGDSVTTASTDQEEEIEVSAWTLGKSDYSIDIGKNKITFGDLLDNPLDPSQLEARSNSSKRRRKKQTKERFLSQSLAECASSKRQPTISEDGPE